MEIPRFIGVLHLPPLPGSPRWSGRNRDDLLESVVRDAQSYAEGGADGLIIENFGDAPFFPGRVPPETVASMAVAAQAIRASGIGLPFGFNVLRNDARSALGLVVAVGGEYVRVNVHCGTSVTDQGIISGQAHETLRVRAALCPGVRILADVNVKHAAPLASRPLVEMAEECLGRGQADALILTGRATGDPVEEVDLREVREKLPDAWLAVGSGVDEANAPIVGALVNTVIVGTSVKRNGDIAQPVDIQRVSRLRERL